MIFEYRRAVHDVIAPRLEEALGPHLPIRILPLLETLGPGVS